MSRWSSRNATKAYLRTLTMGKRGKEPNVAEFISVIAGGNNAQLMVEVCGSTTNLTTMALVAAAQQTMGRVCILLDPIKLSLSKSESSHYSNRVKFVTGDPLFLLSNTYKSADFVIVDCKIDNHKKIIEMARKGGDHKKDGTGPRVVGYNAHKVGPTRNVLGGYFLPIGDGLLVCTRPKVYSPIGRRSKPKGKRSKWIIKVDECTGEEHMFKVTCPH